MIIISKKEHCRNCRREMTGSNYKIGSFRCMSCQYGKLILDVEEVVEKVLKAMKYKQNNNK